MLLRLIREPRKISQPLSKNSGNELLEVREEAGKFYYLLRKS